MLSCATSDIFLLYSVGVMNYIDYFLIIIFGIKSLWPYML